MLLTTWTLFVKIYNLMSIGIWHHITCASGDPRITNKEAISLKILALYSISRAQQGGAFSFHCKMIAHYNRKLLADAIQCIPFHSNFSSFPNSSCNFNKISPQYVWSCAEIKGLNLGCALGTEKVHYPCFARVRTNLEAGINFGRQIWKIPEKIQHTHGASSRKWQTVQWFTQVHILLEYFNALVM